MFKKKENRTGSSDRSLLLDAMQLIIEGDYTPVDTKDFEDSELADKFNEVIAALKISNNNYVMRMNEAMEHIGDNATVKEMIEEVIAQKSSIEDMTGSSKEFETSINYIFDEVNNIREEANSAKEVSALSVINMNNTIASVTDSMSQIQGIHEKIDEFQEKIEQITEIIDIVKKLANQSNLLALNASIEASRAGEAGRGFAIVAGQVKELSSNTADSADTVVAYVEELEQSLSELKELIDTTTSHLQESNENVQHSVQDINNMSEHMDLINGRIHNIHDAVNTQTSVTGRFVHSIESMAESYAVLERDCFDTGNHLRAISRYVDSARGDMARGFSALTTQDWIRVFQIDHHILTWRVYNHIAGFEKLKYEQLNNPSTCKLGKWISGQTDERVLGSSQFHEVKRFHEELHRHACHAWTSMENGDRAEAIAHFDMTLAAYQKFYTAIEAFKAFMRSIGYEEETSIKPYQK